MPTYLCLLLCFTAVFFSCDDDLRSFKATITDKPDDKPPVNIRGISLPKGFKNEGSTDTSYANWLLDIKLRRSNTVYLYNGGLKANQFVQFSVLDIDIGKRDLIQCADAAIKLRADFLFQHQRYEEIKFTVTSGDEISFTRWLKGTRWKEKAGKLIPYGIGKINRNINDEYNSFMGIVFAYCGTYSLSKQLKPVTGIDSIMPGDVFVQGGFPGHAVTVMAVAADNNGKRIFLLSQGYMPAQDIHILKNYADPALSPWYRVNDYPLYTPEWQFERESLKRWE